jgi:phytoene dehydrogenase-like protein
MNTGALDLVFSSSDQSVIEELDLRRHGLSCTIADPWGAYLNPDGASIALWRDPARSVDEIRRFSSRDATAFERMNVISLIFPSHSLLRREREGRPTTSRERTFLPGEASPWMR